MYKSILVLSMVVALSGAASAQEVVEDWFIGGGNGAASGNTWLNAGNAGRGLDFIPAGATQNNKGEAVIAVATGVGATNNIEIMAADDGQNLGNFAMASTGDATLDHYRLAASDDGYIFVNGFGGTVQRYTMTGGAPVEVIADTDYAGLSPAVSGESRALEVTGSVEAGTARIFVGKGLTIVVFGNSLAAPNTFTYIGQIVTDYTGNALVNLASHDGVTLYTSTGTNVAPNDVIKKYTLTYTPTFSATLDGNAAGYAAFIKQGLAINAEGTLLAVAEAGGEEDGFAIANVTDNGLTLTNIIPQAGLTEDADAVYDAGLNDLNAALAVVDTAMDPLTGEVYGYSHGSTGTNGGVMNIRVQVDTGVSDWSVY